MARRAGQPLEGLLLRAAEQFGQHPVGDDGRHVDVGLALEPPDELEGLVDLHLLGCGHDHHAGLGRIGQDLDHPLHLLAHQTDPDEVGHGDRRGQLPDDVPRGGGVDDDEVVVLFLDLPRQLADREDLLHPGRGGGHEVEGAGQRAQSGDQRDLQLEAQVLLEGLLGVHRHGRQVGCDLGGREPELGCAEEVGEVPLGVDLTDQRAFAVPRRQRGQRRGDGGLPDAALAGDEQQPPIEQGGDVHGAPVRRRSRWSDPPRATRSRRTRSWMPGWRRPGPACR